MSKNPPTERTAAWPPEELRAWRKRLGLSVAEAGARLGRTEDATKQLLSGRRKITVGVRFAAEEAERQLTGAARPRRRRAAPEPPPTAAADDALLEAALSYADAIADRVHAVSIGALTRGHIDAVNAAARRLDTVSNAGGYARAAGARAAQVVRCADAAMDALRLMRIAGQELEAVRAQTAPDALLAAYLRGREGGVAIEVERQPGIVGGLTAGGGGSSIPLIAGPVDLIGSPSSATDRRRTQATNELEEAQAQAQADIDDVAPDLADYVDSLLDEVGPEANAESEKPAPANRQRASKPKKKALV